MRRGSHCQGQCQRHPTGARPRVCTWTPALLPGAAQLARPRPEWKAKGAQVAAWDEAAECGPQTRQSAAISGSWLSVESAT